MHSVNSSHASNQHSTLSFKNKSWTFQIISREWFWNANISPKQQHIYPLLAQGWSRKQRPNSPAKDWLTLLTFTTSTRLTPSPVYIAVASLKKRMISTKYNGKDLMKFWNPKKYLSSPLSLSLDKDTSTICTLEQILSNSKFLPLEHLNPNKSSVFHRAVFNYQIHLSTSSFNQNGSEEQWQFLLQWGSCLHLHPLPLWRPGSEGRKIVEEHDIFYHIGVSKYTGGPPKWMVYIMVPTLWTNGWFGFKTHYFWKKIPVFSWHGHVAKLGKKIYFFLINFVNFMEVTNPPNQEVLPRDQKGIPNTLPKTNSSPWKIHRILMEFTRKHWDFHGRTVSFREGT